MAWHIFSVVTHFMCNCVGIYLAMIRTWGEDPGALRFTVLMTQVSSVRNLMKRNRFDRKMMSPGCLWAHGWVNGPEA